MKSPTSGPRSRRRRPRVRLRHVASASALGALGFVAACDAFDAAAPDATTPTEAAALPARASARPLTPFAPPASASRAPSLSEDGGGTMGSEDPPR